tara:strand:- start:1058 stop:1300 length:243 start_codon:yes stop_codon:yes gene_type:complete
MTPEEVQEKNFYNLTVDEIKHEVSLLTVENIRKYPCGRPQVEDFYNMWQRFGPQAARDIMIPYVWYGNGPKPSEVFGRKD